MYFVIILNETNMNKMNKKNKKIKVEYDYLTL